MSHKSRQEGRKDSEKGINATDRVRYDGDDDQHNYFGEDVDNSAANE